MRAGQPDMGKGLLLLFRAALVLVAGLLFVTGFLLVAGLLVFAGAGGVFVSVGAFLASFSRKCGGCGEDGHGG